LGAHRLRDLREQSTTNRYISFQANSAVTRPHARRGLRPLQLRASQFGGACTTFDLARKPSPRRFTFELCRRCPPSMQLALQALQVVWSDLFFASPPWQKVGGKGFGLFNQLSVVF
jgi:hypothetical protein